MSFALVIVKTLQAIQTFSSDSVPNLIVWPNGDASYSPSEGDERGGIRFVRIVFKPDQPNEFYEIKDISPSLDKTSISYVRKWGPKDLGGVKAVLKQRINERAAQQRGKYITLGPGQELTYQQKVQEARECAEDAKPDAAKYRMLSASLGIDGDDIKAVAETVLAANDKWIEANCQIECIRRKSEDEIDKAKTVDDAIAAHDKAKWG